MIFDKNQKEFPSETHKKIWDAGIHILPLEVTLSYDLREKLSEISPDLPESCEQLQQYFFYWLGDMYENVELYKPESMFIQFRLFVDWGLLGEAEKLDDSANSLVINRFVFDNFISKAAKSTQFKNDKKLGIDIDYRLKLLERTGLVISKHDNKVIFTNKLYPKMFAALCELAKITLKGKGRANDNPSFMYCDFRKICKDYKYDKYEYAHIFLNDGQREIADKLVSFALNKNMTRSINASHSQGFIIEYSYEKKKILELNCQGNEILLEICIPFDRQNPESISPFMDMIENDSDELKKYFVKHLSRCRVCNPKCGGYTITIFGKTNRLCRTWNGVLSLSMHVSEEDLQSIEKILSYAIDYINIK